MPVVDKFNVDGVDYTIQTTIDPVPTQDSQNAVMSGGVYDEIARIDESVAELDNTRATKNEVNELKQWNLMNTSFMPVADLSGVLLSTVKAAPHIEPDDQGEWYVAGGYGKITREVHSLDPTFDVNGTLAEGYGIYYSNDAVKWTKSSDLSTRAIQDLFPFTVSRNGRQYCLAVINKLMEKTYSGACMYRSIDGGRTWAAVTGLDNYFRFERLLCSPEQFDSRWIDREDSSTYSLMMIEGTISQTAAAGTKAYYTSTDGGATWQPFTFPVIDGMPASTAMVDRDNDGYWYYTNYEEVDGVRHYKRYRLLANYLEAADVLAAISDATRWKDTGFFIAFNYDHYVELKSCDTGRCPGQSMMYRAFTRTVDGVTRTDIWETGYASMFTLPDNLRVLCQILRTPSGIYFIGTTGDVRNENTKYIVWRVRGSYAVEQTSTNIRTALGYTSGGQTYPLVFNPSPIAAYVSKRLFLSYGVAGSYGSYKLFYAIGGCSRAHLCYSASDSLLMAFGIGTPDSIPNKYLSINNYAVNCGLYICPIRTSTTSMN